MEPVFSTEDGTMTNPWWTGLIDLSDWDSEEDDEWDG